MGAVFATFREKPSIDEIISLWENYENEATRMNLPSSPAKFLRYFREDLRGPEYAARQEGGILALDITPATVFSIDIQ